MPVFQWMYFDSLECLKEEGRDETEANYQPQGSRYDGQIAVFGKDFQKKMLATKYFIVSLYLLKLVKCVKHIKMKIFIIAQFSTR